ncbi:RNA polymerase sigma-70 factor, TIGR02952 family [Streptomyces sp. KS_5]|nr:RNA polymerase sigma-70 factor, TIGR02952 family [Streptomyces sp. KS_5]
MTQTSPPDTTPRASGGTHPEPAGSQSVATMAFEEFCETYHARLVAQATAYSRSRDAALDAVQDALLDALPRWDDIHNPWAYVSTAVRRNIWADHRQAIRTAPVTVAAAEEELTFADSSEAVVHHVTLLSAVRDLPTMQRSVVVLHYFEDLPVQDVAGFLAVGESTVRTHLALARRRLRKLLTAPVSAGTAHRRSTASRTEPKRLQPGAAHGGEPANPDPVTALVARSQAGQPEAFGALYDKYADRVYGYIYLRIGERAPAEELTAKTFLRAMRRIHLFTWQGRDFNAWLLAIARPLVTDYVDTNNFRLGVSGHDILDSPGAPEAGEEPLPGDPPDNAELIEAIRSLSPPQQECITLRFLQGLSVAETARIMGKNEGAIKTLQHRALRALTKTLSEPTPAPTSAASEQAHSRSSPLVSRALHDVAAECTRAVRPTPTARRRMRAVIEEQPILVGAAG